MFHPATDQVVAPRAMNSAPRGDACCAPVARSPCPCVCVRARAVQLVINTERQRVQALEAELRKVNGEKTKLLRAMKTPKPKQG
jgi:hypothetical protein